MVTCLGQLPGHHRFFVFDHLHEVSYKSAFAKGIATSQLIFIKAVPGAFRRSGSSLQIARPFVQVPKINDFDGQSGVAIRVMMRKEKQAVFQFFKIGLVPVEHQGWVR